MIHYRSLSYNRVFPTLEAMHPAKPILNHGSWKEKMQTNTTAPENTHYTANYWQRAYHKLSAKP